MAWRQYLASPLSGLPSDFPLPSAMATTPMDYAYARFRSDRNSKAIYRAVSRTRLESLPKPHQLYWRISGILPGWLFRRSFDFVYGQTRLKMAVRKLLQPAGRQTGNIPFDVLGVRVQAVQIPDVVAQMENWIRDRGPCHSIAPTDMHGITEAKHDPLFKEILNSTDLVVPDGTPLVWLGRRQGKILPRRMYGPDLMLAFCEKTAALGAAISFMDGRPVCRRPWRNLSRLDSQVLLWPELSLHLFAL